MHPTSDNTGQKSTPSIAESIESNLVDLSEEHLGDYWRKPHRISSYEHGQKEDVVKNLTVGRVNLEGQNIPFMIVNGATRTEDVLLTMANRWKLKLPTAVLNLVCDADLQFGMQRKKDQKLVIAGILKCAHMVTGMWVVTKGYDCGIIKNIGEAFHADYVRKLSLVEENDFDDPDPSIYRTTVLGVCREETLTYGDKFQFVPEECVRLKNKGRHMEGENFELNYHHSHFILVKDPTVPKHSYSNFMLRFERMLSVCQRTRNSRVPVVALLIGGSSSSIHYIMEHMRNRLPVIVLKGSGGLADILAYVHYEFSTQTYHDTKDVEYLENVIKPSLRLKIIQTFPHLQENIIVMEYFCGRVLDCICHFDTNYMYVVDMQDRRTSVENLNRYVFKALFQTQRKRIKSLEDQPKKDLLLAIQWNCPEFARFELFSTCANIAVDNAMFYLLLCTDNREDFVALILRQGFQAHHFLSSAVLISLFKVSLDNHFFNQVCWQNVLGYEKDIDIQDDFIDTDFNFLIELLSGMSVYVSAEELDLSAMRMYNPRHKKRDDATFAEQKALCIIIIWALFSYRFELAETVLKCTGLPITFALTSSYMLTNLASYTTNPYYKAELTKYSKRFSEFGCGVFEAGYDEFPCRALYALEQKNVVWEDHNLLSIANRTHNADFVALPCCQKYIEDMFMGKIRIRQLKWGFVKVPEFAKIMLSAVLIFPMYVWILFTSHSHKPNIRKLRLNKFKHDHEELNHVGEKCTSLLPKRHHKHSEDDDNPSVEGRGHLTFPALNKMIYYVWTAPITKYWTHFTSYIVFLVLLCFTVLWPGCGNKVLDVIVLLWTGTFLLESFFIVIDLMHVQDHNDVLFFIGEMMFMGTFITALTIADLFPFIVIPFVRKIILCIAILFFFYRVTYVFLPKFRILGPMLCSMKRLIMVDFKHFMLLTSVVMLSNGIVMQAVLFPDFELNAELIRRIFHRAWITLFVTPDAEFTDVAKQSMTYPSKDCIPRMKDDASNERCILSPYDNYMCPVNNIWPHLFSLQYFIVLKLGLVTLLVAMFGSSHSAFKQRNKQLWKFRRFPFVSQYSLHSPLPPPLNVIFFLYQFLRRCCCQFYFKSVWKKKETIKQRCYSCSAPEYKYWKHMNQRFNFKEDYNTKRQKFNERKLDLLDEITETLKNQDALLRGSRAQIQVLKSNLRTSQLFVRTRHLWKRSRDGGYYSEHKRSRQSPYPGTKVERFPVASKFVPWEVKWENYQPEYFTLQRSQFPPYLQLHVDDEIDPTTYNEHSPNAFQWNMKYTDQGGVYHDRSSWVSDCFGKPGVYKLEGFLPVNPMGRTGLQGRGALPSWGPNHYIFVIITKWKTSHAGQRPLLEVIETWHARRNDLSFPGGYIFSVNCYQIIQAYFQSGKEKWKTESDMLEYFRSAAGAFIQPRPGPRVQTQLLHCGYMDDPLNTDQAWKEVQAWHIHYLAPLKKSLCDKPRMAWRAITEDVFTYLPCEQTSLLQKVIAKMNLQLF